MSNYQTNPRETLAPRDSFIQQGVSFDLALYCGVGLRNQQNF